MRSLKGKTIFITGSTRGIGRAMALRFAQDGANIIITGKTDKPHPKLEGTIHTVAEEVEKAGGKALAIQLDVRDDAAIEAAMKQAAEHFGGIDVLINNASAIMLKNTEDLAMKRFDLMMGVNMRATFACSKFAIPYLKKSDNPHILNMAPPLNMDAKWFKDHLAYTYSKYGMSVCTLGMAEEFKQDSIAVNSLWPKTIIATAAIAGNFPPELMQMCRKPEIVADAAYAIITKESGDVSGNFFIDEDVLKSEGVDELLHYSVNPEAKLCPDYFLD